MSIFTSTAFDKHEQVMFCYDQKSGLKAIIAIHSTKLGPAIGGCRIYPYTDEQEAVIDALRLSKGMTYKAAMADLPFGGGKAVIMVNSQKKTPEMLEAFGHFVNRLNGLYITAKDVGTTLEDTNLIHKTTPYVVGLPEGSGDPSPMTAFGVFEGIKAAVNFRLGKTTLEDIKVAVQGLGHVGESLCPLLLEAGAKLFITDTNPKTIAAITSKYQVTAVESDAIYSVDADVFSPCAMGAILNDKTIPQFKFSVIAGSANNQLEHSRHGQILAEKNILYAPDYVINSGGLINVSYENNHYDVKVVKNHVSQIYDTLLMIFEKAQTEQTPTNIAADCIAEERFLRKK